MTDQGAPPRLSLQRSLIALFPDVVANRGQWEALSEEQRGKVLSLAREAYGVNAQIIPNRFGEMAIARPNDSGRSPVCAWLAERVLLALQSEAPCGKP